MTGSPICSREIRERDRERERNKRNSMGVNWEREQELEETKYKNFIFGKKVQFEFEKSIGQEVNGLDSTNYFKPCSTTNCNYIFGTVYLNRTAIQLKSINTLPLPHFILEPLLAGYTLVLVL